MKAQDLMLGDWVYGIDGKGGKHPCRINAVDIYPQNRTPRVVTSGGYGYQQENLEPIPLTPDILEKNGFEKQGFEGWLLPFGTKPENGLILWRTDYGTPHLMIESYSSKYGDFRSFGIQYAHELQHALRLCWIDKEIVI